MTPDDPRHGTNAGYVAHYYDGEKPCDKCRRGKARSDKQYRAARQSRNVPAIGLHRRIRALQALGWTQNEIARAAGYPNGSYIRQYLLRDTCNVATWRRIVAAYDRLSMTLPPPKPYRAATLTAARSKGWLPPLAYDDERIDDPNYKPSRDLVGSSPRHYAGSLIAEVTHLTSLGVSVHQAARQLGVTVGAIEKAMERARGAA